MRTGMIVAALICASTFGSTVMAADDEAGVPLTTAEAAGVWTLESAGHNLCTIRLETTRVGAGYGARPDASCSETLGGVAASWQSTHDGMRLISADGGPLLGFSRWSNSLFVSHRASGVDVQLRRGEPPVRPAS